LTVVPGAPILARMLMIRPADHVVDLVAVQLGDLLEHLIHDIGT
jgi:hypothetical protein